MALALGVLGLSGVAAAQNESGNASASETAGNQTGNQTEGGGGEPTTHEVAMITEGSDFIFDPIGLHIQPGDTVTWVLESGTHTSTAYEDRIPEGAEAWDSGNMSQEGAEFSHTFEQEGTYDYYCTPHKQLGMIGRIVVGEPGGPAEEDTPPDTPPTSGEFPSSDIIVDQGSLAFPFTGGGDGGGGGGEDGGDGGEVSTAIPLQVKTLGFGVIGALGASLLGGYVSLRYGRGMSTASAAAVVALLLGVLFILGVAANLVMA